MKTPTPPSSIRIINAKPTLTERVAAWRLRGPRIPAKTAAIIFGMQAAMVGAMLAYQLYQVYHTGQPPEHYSLDIIGYPDGTYCTTLHQPSGDLMATKPWEHPTGVIATYDLHGDAVETLRGDTSDSTMEKIVRLVTNGKYGWGCTFSESSPGVTLQLNGSDSVNGGL